MEATRTAASMLSLGGDSRLRVRPGRNDLGRADAPPGAAELVSDLRQTGIRVVFASNSSRHGSELLAPSADGDGDRREQRRGPDRLRPRRR